MFEALENEDYECLDFLTYELDYTAPLAVSSITTPPYLWDSKEMNISADPDYRYSDILTTIIPLASSTKIILAAFHDDPHGSEYLDQMDLMTEVSFQKALTWHILTNTENVFFSPLWYNKINQPTEDYIIKLSAIAADVTTPFLKYDEKKFPINLFDEVSSI